jgi:hypothetical protein
MCELEGPRPETQSRDLHALLLADGSKDDSDGTWRAVVLLRLPR